MKYDKYAQQFLNNVKDCVSEKTKDFVTIKSAIISRINDNGTVDVQFPEDGGTWSNITNQSIYQDLKVGDEVKLIQQNGVLKNCWIIGALQTSKKQNILQQVSKKIDEQEQSKVQENTYLKTNVTLETTDDGTSKPSLSAKDYAYKYCVHSVEDNTGKVTDYLYFSKRITGVFDWVQIC